MEFVDFRERTVLIAEDQPEYITLPAHQVRDNEGTTFIKMKFTDEEIEYIVKTKCAYMSVLTFNKPFPPLMVYAHNPFPYIQHLTDNLAVIYYKDTQEVIFYTPDGTFISSVAVDAVKDWTEVLGFGLFDYYRIATDMFGKVWLHLTKNRKTGLTIMLNAQFKNGND